MGFIPIDPPPRECFKSDKEWYEYARGELEAQRAAMPNVSLGGVLAVAVGFSLVVFGAVLSML